MCKQVNDKITIVLLGITLILVNVRSIAGNVDPVSMTTFSAGSPAIAADINNNFTEQTTQIDDNSSRISVLEGGDNSALAARVTSLEQQVQTLSNAVVPLLPQSSTFDLSNTGLAAFGYLIESNGFLWVDGFDESVNAYLMKINAGTGAPVFQIPLSAQRHIAHTWDGDMCSDGTNIWYVDPNGTAIFSQDGTLIDSAAGGVNCEFDGTNMWVISNNYLYKYDPFATGSIGTVVAQNSVGSDNLRGLTVDNNYIWVVGNDEIDRIEKANFSNASSYARYYLSISNYSALEGDDSSLWLVRGSSLFQYPKSVLTSALDGTNISNQYISSTANVASGDPTGEYVRVMLDGTNAWVFSSSLGTITKVVQSNGLFVESINIGAGHSGFTIDSLYYYYAKSNFLTPVIEKVIK